MRKVLLVMMMGMAFPYLALAGIWPNDQPTIEALIDQHKRCMSAEDQSNQQLAANAAIKDMVKDVAKKYDRTDLAQQIADQMTQFLSLYYTE